MSFKPMLEAWDFTLLELELKLSIIPEEIDMVNLRPM